MGQIIMIYEAKCKHCIHFEYKSLIKKDGTKSKVKRAFCNNENSKLHNTDLTLKSKACDNLEL